MFTKIFTNQEFITEVIIKFLSIGRYFPILKNPAFLLETVVTWPREIIWISQGPKLSSSSWIPAFLPPGGVIAVTCAEVLIFRWWGNLLLFSCSGTSDSLWPNGLQHAKLPCPSPTPRAYSNLCPSSQWCHPTKCLIHYNHCKTYVNKLWIFIYQIGKE